MLPRKNLPNVQDDSSTIKHLYTVDYRHAATEWKRMSRRCKTWIWLRGSKYFRRVSNELSKVGLSWRSLFCCETIRNCTTIPNTYQLACAKRHEKKKKLCIRYDLVTNSCKLKTSVPFTCYYIKE